MDDVEASDPASDDTRALEALFFVSDEPLGGAPCWRRPSTWTVARSRRCATGWRHGWRTGGADSSCATSRADGACTPTPTPRPSSSSSCCPRARPASRRRPWRRSSIVAYKQPVTRHQVNSIRGVNSDGVLRALVDRGLVEEAGREEGPGRPVLYGTTPGFLERLGLPSLAALPSLAPLLGAADVEEPTATDRVADDEHRPRPRRRRRGRADDDRRTRPPRSLERAAAARAGAGRLRVAARVRGDHRGAPGDPQRRGGDPGRQGRGRHRRGAGRRSHREPRPQHEVLRAPQARRRRDDDGRPSGPHGHPLLPARRTARACSRWAGSTATPRVC